MVDVKRIADRKDANLAIHESKERLRRLEYEQAVEREKKRLDIEEVRHMSISFGMLFFNLNTSSPYRKRGRRRTWRNGWSLVGTNERKHEERPR